MGCSESEWWGAQLAQSIELETLDPGVMSSSSTLDVEIT